MQLVTARVVEQWARLTDEQVVGRVLGGQTALFEVIMRRHNERLYRVARAILRDEAEAEDVLQQAYVNAYAHLRQFDGRAAFATWLTRIAANEAFARLRKRDRVRQLDEDGEPADVVDGAPAVNPESHAMLREMTTLIEAAVDRLPEGSREVFVLRLVEGLSTNETADSLGINADAVKTRLSRAKRLVRQDLLNKAGDAARAAFPFGRSRCDRVVLEVLQRIG
jgi:RNA polymerase sigma-70 factor (ECF subfamily)